MKLLVILIIVQVTVCHDFYVGMFRYNDLLVAQDNLYRERVPYRRVVAKYGRKFPCPITYMRVVDRLGVGRGPTVEVLRGGLLNYYVVLRLTSVYNQPVSVNIYIGCENYLVPSKSISSEGSEENSTTTTRDSQTTIVLL